MSRGPDAATLLERALIHNAARAGVAVHVAEAQSTRWASATFSGARHVLSMTVGGDDASGRWLAALPEAELPLRGHLVADLAVVRKQRSSDRIEAVVEALTVEER
ncbi:hypothetical protein LZK98_08085 [Sphingomonas cannabina]|uniref:hypothetical protein n=1 Tax=Sphingomonas cannabina TaxID=2899123 RepID=UPI001F31FC73|nr:hypothetical protein [Sphingomonas cannabina]UIJ46889.1 hypothetical protein LZK98_08085 [Sphingomonas cannabina]